MQKKFQKQTSNHWLIYWMVLSGLFFIAGCIGNITPIVENTQPNPKQETDPTFSPVDNYYYYLDGKRVQLTPSLNWISVQFINPDPSMHIGALQKYASLLGPLEQIRNIPAPEISLLPLPEDTTLQKVTELLDVMRKDQASFSQVNPVFHTQDAEMAMSDEFIATFPPGKSRAEIDKINVAHAVELVRPLLGQENTFVLRVAHGATLDVLSMANLYQESGIVLNASPNFIRIEIK